MKSGTSGMSQTPRPSTPWHRMQYRLKGSLTYPPLLLRAPHPVPYPTGVGVRDVPRPRSMLWSFWRQNRCGQAFPHGQPASAVRIGRHRQQRPPAAEHPIIRFSWAIGKLQTIARVHDSSNQSNWHRFLSDRGIRSTGMISRFGSHPYALSEETPALPRRISVHEADLLPRASHRAGKRAKTRMLRNMGNRCIQSVLPKERGVLPSAMRSPSFED